MRKNIFANSLKVALLALPFLAGCKGATPMIVIPPQGLTLPDCTQGQLISVGQDKVLGCTQALTTNLSPPSCPAGYALNAVDGNLLCMPVGTGSTNPDLLTAITNLNSKTTNVQNMISQFGGGGGAAQFCGVTTETTQGQINEGNARGSAAAAAKCAKIPACGAGSHMCTVYEMYESVAAGIIKSDQVITPPAWVFMASWVNTSGSTEPTAGLADNCASYTYGSAHKIWGGTAIEWSGRLDTNDKVLKIFSGMSAAGCGTARQIACCK